MLVRALNSASGGGGSTIPITVTLNFKLALNAPDVKVCKLTSSSSGSITFTSSDGYYNNWSVSGKTVTKTGGSASAIAFYVTGDYLYAHNGSSATNPSSYTGSISNAMCDENDTELTREITVK